MRSSEKRQVSSRLIDTESILVVGPSWVGDMVMAQSLFKVLRCRAPGTTIDVLAPGWSRPLLERMPEVTRAIDMPLGHGKFGLRTRWQLGRQLHARGYAQAILLPNSWKSGLVPFFAGIPRRTGWLGEQRYGLLNDIRKLDKARLSMTVQRFVALAEEPHASLPQIPPPFLQVDPDSVQHSLAELNITPPAGPLLALCPGAEYGPAKRWPAAYYAKLAANMLKQGWSAWLFGSEKDALVCEQVNREAGGLCINLAGRTSLNQAVDLLSISRAVVTNDSGLMHVAAALERPLLALYGSSDPTFTPPLNAAAQILSLRLACSPCFKRKCPLEHLQCLRDISVEKVQDALVALI